MVEADGYLQLLEEEEEGEEEGMARSRVALTHMPDQQDNMKPL